MLWKTFKLLTEGNWLTFCNWNNTYFVQPSLFYEAWLLKLMNSVIFLRTQTRQWRWNEMVVWIHETTLTTKSDAATCYKKSGAAGFSKDSVSEIFNLLQRAVEHKVNAFRIYVHKVDGSDLKTF